jgi:hypothetical protein
VTLIEESPQQRAERYMRQATELARLAAKSNDTDIASTYLEMARVWLKLAEDLKLTAPANDDTDDEADDSEAARG